MKVEKVELLIVTFPSNLLQHHHVKCIRIAHRSIEAQRAWPCRMEFGSCSGISARKQGYIISKRDKFLRQPVYDPLGAAIEFRRNSLRQRSYLRDAHLSLPFFSMSWTNAPQSPAHRRRKGNVFASA